ncbi:UNVERIFIED_CONTAM: hypothetical protein Sradi_0518200 [Sesamum radiatum]|uniref:Retrotransposon gag domain-containing protein n=1 Tax=Sesamum radiatum TaxID=300843 RepID=A0AAW2VHH7_SESRA
MQTRSQASDVYGVDITHEIQGSEGGQAPPREQSPPHEQAPLNEEVMSPYVEPPPRGVPPQEAMIQLTQKTLFALIRDASARAAAQAIAQFAAQRPINLPPSPRRSRELSSTPEEEQRQEENLPEYDRTGDLQEHLDKFYAKFDWYDLSDAAYCKVFRTTLSKRALAWFNQLPVGTISSLEQLTQRFLHHFSMNKRVPKTAAFLFTIRQKENESLRDYMQRFVEAVHEVPHINYELLASIIQQNFLLGRFKESIAGKPPRNGRLADAIKNTLESRSPISRTLPLALRGMTERRRKSRRMKNANT